MNKEERLEKIRNIFPGAQAAAAEREDMITITVEKEALYPLAEFLRKTLAYDYLQFLAAIDRLTALELQYHLYSYGHRGKMIVKTTVERTNGKVVSLAALWRTADWHERETCDLFGVTFQGHPDLRRILLDDGFEGHPLLKDYASEKLVPLPKL
ncbi:MAG: NADH-quinone oxidoreductase subunit C [Endomicrobiales bacterium]